LPIYLQTDAGAARKGKVNGAGRRVGGRVQGGKQRQHAGGVVPVDAAAGYGGYAIELQYGPPPFVTAPEKPRPLLPGEAVDRQQQASGARLMNDIADTQNRVLHVRREDAQIFFVQGCKSQ